jgi:transcriptional regulator with XRE-family HTH domain
VARKNPVRQLERVLIGRIRAVAEERGMPMSHLAARAGISRSSLWEVMNGRASPTLDWVQRIAEVLEVEPLALMTGEPVRLPRRKPR